MEKGILERIEERLQRMEEKLDGSLGQLENISSDKEDIRVTLESLAETPLHEIVKPTVESIGSGLFDDLGFEWDARVHSAKKGKTAAGLWKKVRGCDKDLYEKVMEEQGLRMDVPDAPENKTVSAPTAPENKTTPDAPPPPVNKTPPAPPSIDPIEEEKKKAMSSISSLTTSCGVPFGDVLAQLPEGVTSFDSLPKEQYKEFGLKMKTWVDWLGMIHDENLKVQELGGQAGIDGMMVVYGYYDKATQANQIAPEHLSTVYESIKEYREKWEAIQ